MLPPFAMPVTSKKNDRFNYYIHELSFTYTYYSHNLAKTLTLSPYCLCNRVFFFTSRTSVKYSSIY